MLQRDGTFKRFCRLYFFLDFLVVKKAHYIGFMTYFNSQHSKRRLHH